MLENLLHFDSDLLVYLNSLGSKNFDSIWLFITKQAYWTPLFLVLLYTIYKKLGLKQTLYLILFLAILITITDQFTNLVKNNVQRLRPCNNPEIKDIIRIVQHRNSFSFFSGHAANSMASVTFLFFALRKNLKYIGWFFLWSLVFAYSRIYLGLHYPLDIFSGFVVGFTFGLIMYKIYKKAQVKYFPT